MRMSEDEIQDEDINTRAIGLSSTCMLVDEFVSLDGQCCLRKVLTGSRMVLALATWFQNYNFITNIRLSGLSLTASLKAAQVSSTLLLYQSQCQAVTTRVLVQSALSRYNHGIPFTSVNVSTVSVSPPADFGSLKAIKLIRIGSVLRPTLRALLVMETSWFKQPYIPVSTWEMQQPPAASSM